MKKTILIAAAACFIANPKMDELHVTRDGQCFEKWHDANEHSKTLGSTADDRLVEKVKRDDASEEIAELESGDVKLTFAQKVEACTTVAEVEALIKKNTAKADKELAAEKIKALTANA
jgi:hypothetical protein